MLYKGCAGQSFNNYLPPETKRAPLLLSVESKALEVAPKGRGVHERIPVSACTATIKGLGSEMAAVRALRGIGLVNLCRFNGLNVQASDPLIPEELLIPVKAQ